MTSPYAYTDEYGRPLGTWSNSPPPVGQIVCCPRCSKMKSSGMKLAQGSKWWWWHVMAMCAIGMNFLMLLVIIGLTAFIVHQVR